MYTPTADECLVASLGKEKTLSLSSISSGMLIMLEALPLLACIFTSSAACTWDFSHFSCSSLFLKPSASGYSSKKWSRPSVKSITMCSDGKRVISFDARCSPFSFFATRQVTFSSSWSIRPFRALTRALGMSVGREFAVTAVSMVPGMPPSPIGSRT